METFWLHEPIHVNPHAKVAATGGPEQQRSNPQAQPQLPQATQPP
jgi:hypothetical protein